MMVGHLVRAIFTALLLAIVVWLGQTPMGKPSGVAVVRLALRTVHGRVEVCTERTQEELLELPLHMRQPRTCDIFAPAYRLRVVVDREELLDREVSAGGLRGDRPLVVDAQIRLPPGEKQLEVFFTPVDPENLDPEALAAFVELPRFRLDEWVRFEADRITLVLLDEAGERLTLYDG